MACGKSQSKLNWSNPFHALPSFVLMQIWSILLIFTLSLSIVHAKRATAPTNFLVIGDRFSGVGFLTSILNQTEGFTLKSCNFKPPFDERWQRAFLTPRELENNLACNVDSTVFFLITKDPFSWVHSVAKRKYETERLTLLHLQAIVSNKYVDNLDLNRGLGGYSHSTSLLQIRTKKLKAHNSIMKKMKYSVHIRYEDLLQHPDTAIKNVLRTKGIVNGALNATSAVNRDEERTKFYLNKEYLNLFTPKAMSRSVKQLNKRLEKTFGYKVQPLDDTTFLKNIRMRRSLIQLIGHYFMNLLWWIVAPTSVLITLSMPLLLWRDIKKWISPSQRSSLSEHESKVVWVEMAEKANGRRYYMNKRTGQVQWNRPYAFVPSNDNIKFD